MLSIQQYPAFHIQGVNCKTQTFQTHHCKVAITHCCSCIVVLYRYCSVESLNLPEDCLSYELCCPAADPEHMLREFRKAHQSGPLSPDSQRQGFSVLISLCITCNMPPHINDRMGRRPVLAWLVGR